MKKIQVLGSGCAKCKKLKKMVDAAVKKMNLDARVEKVEDINEIMEFGVMMTPALVVDGEVKLAGRMPGRNELLKILK